VGRVQCARGRRDAGTRGTPGGCGSEELATRAASTPTRHRLSAVHWSVQPAAELVATTAAAAVVKVGEEARGGCIAVTSVRTPLPSASTACAAAACLTPTLRRQQLLHMPRRDGVARGVPHGRRRAASTNAQRRSRHPRAPWPPWRRPQPATSAHWGCAFVSPPQSTPPHRRARSPMRWSCPGRCAPARFPRTSDLASRRRQQAQRAGERALEQRKRQRAQRALQLLGLSHLGVSFSRIVFAQRNVHGGCPFSAW